jgi:hypothetical protein
MRRNAAPGDADRQTGPGACALSQPIRYPRSMARRLGLLHALLAALSRGRAALSLERLPDDPVLRVGLDGGADRVERLRQARLANLAGRGFTSPEPGLLQRRGPAGLSVVGVGAVAEDAATGRCWFEVWALGPHVLEPEASTRELTAVQEKVA